MHQKNSDYVEIFSKLPKQWHCTSAHIMHDASQTFVRGLGVICLGIEQWTLRCWDIIIKHYVQKHKQEHDSLFVRLIALVFDILIDAAEDSCNPPLSLRCCITHNIFLCENQSFDWTYFPLKSFLTYLDWVFCNP